MITREMLVIQLATILKRNAPVRGENVPAGKKRPYMGPTKESPYPGNLRNNGITERQTDRGFVVAIGGPAAPYAVYTERTSYKPGWIDKSYREYIQMLQRQGGVIK